MIQVYTQYSFGGYRIFEATQSGLAEVSANDRRSLNDTGIHLFSHYGVKLLFARDAEHKFNLFVTDIPCRDKDDMGRAKTISLLLTGTNLEDRNQLRAAAVLILLELKNFEAFISELFTVTDSLDFDYAKFMQFMESANRTEGIEEDRLRKALLNKPYPIIAYSAADTRQTIRDLSPWFRKSYLKQSYFFKWDSSTQKIQNKVVEKYGFTNLLYRIIFSITSIWKN